MNSALILNRQSSNLRLFWFAAFALLLLFLAAHFFQIVSLNEKEFMLRAHKSRMNELSERNRTLEIEFSLGNSLEKIETKVEALNFEKTAKIHYIKLMEGSVASK